MLTIIQKLEPRRKIYVQALQNRAAILQYINNGRYEMEGSIFLTADGHLIKTADQKIFKAN